MVPRQLHPIRGRQGRVRDRVGTANGRDGYRRGLFENCQRRIRRGGGDGVEDDIAEYHGIAVNRVM